MYGSPTVAVKSAKPWSSVGGWWPRTPAAVSSQVPSSTGTYTAPRGLPRQPRMLTAASGAPAGPVGRNIRVA